MKKINAEIKSIDPKTIFRYEIIVTPEKPEFEQVAQDYAKTAGLKKDTVNKFVSYRKTVDENPTLPMLPNGLKAYCWSMVIGVSGSGKFCDILFK